MSGTLLVLKCNIPAVSKLRALVTKLERLMVLHSSYQCKVSLKELTMVWLKYIFLESFIFYTIFLHLYLHD